MLYRDDTDRRRFLGLVSELPERFSLEVHTFVGLGYGAAAQGIRRFWTQHPQKADFRKALVSRLSRVEI